MARTDRLEALSEIGDAGSESDQMDELLNALLIMARLIMEARLQQKCWEDL